MPVPPPFFFFFLFFPILLTFAFYYCVPSVFYVTGFHLLVCVLPSPLSSWFPLFRVLFHDPTLPVLLIYQLYLFVSLSSSGWLRAMCSVYLTCTLYLK